VRQWQTVKGYEIVSRPTNAGAGKCLWAFARKDGQEYFIKEFLDPKRPRPDSMGTVEDKKRRYAECERFEQRQWKMARLLRGDHPRAGNLVLTVDFFAEGTRYYKVTKRVYGAEILPHELDPLRQIILLRTLAESLRLLHECGIVHGDLKPENVLLYQPRRSDLYTAKLIDFDDAYPTGDPPPRDVVIGNPLYGAPEWLAYLSGESSVRAKDLTGAVDMFAFGLLAHTYLYGSLPKFPPGYDSPAAAVRAGQHLCWDRRLHGRWADLLPALTDPKPTARPDIVEVADVLAADGEGTPIRPGARPVSRVRVNLTGRTPKPKHGGRLRINLGENRE
jgi:serine/threonine protein kinase